MKKFLIAVVGCAAFAVMAGPHGCGGHNHGSDGVRLATDIVDLVGASLNILAPRTVVTTPVVTPVVAPVAPRGHGPGSRSRRREPGDLSLPPLLPPLPAVPAAASRPRQMPSPLKPAVLF